MDVTQKRIKNLLPKRDSRAHKGDFGRVLVLAGSPGMEGAAFLASLAALRSGCGLVYLAAEKTVTDIVSSMLAEAVKKTLPLDAKGLFSKKSYGALKNLIDDCQSIIVGPGCGDSAKTLKLVQFVLRTAKIPVLIDADGLNVLKGNLPLLKKRTAPLVITPHDGELMRLFAVSKSDLKKKRKELVRQLSKKYNISVVLKGHGTLIASPDGTLYQNTTGNDGMATAGSGDVLSGMIGSFLAQGLPASAAATAGVYLHGLSGDIAAKDKTAYCLTASDLIQYLPNAFKKVI